jgi:L-ascorbate metabolism protein UlaG (beta-lactamase superfamily)
VSERDSKLGNGMQAWRQMSNHNAMIEFQDTKAQSADPASEGGVEIAFFGSSAFRITTPLGLTLMVDPWRNFPTQKWDWYFRDFPNVAVDIGVSSHAHFDHDALTQLDAHVLLDRLIGTYEFGDLKITGIADKHETDSSQATWDFKRVIMEMDGIDITPPNNPRSWDHCLLLIETGGLRILHWGDNRHNPPARVWERLGRIDILLMPIDQSRHVMGYGMAEAAIDQLQPHVVIPHHYYIFDVIQRQSTLMSAHEWVIGRAHECLTSAAKVYTRTQLVGLDRMVHYFGEHVAFDAKAWRDGDM